jgi:hypothetical protein
MDFQDHWWSIWKGFLNGICKMVPMVKVNKVYCLSQPGMQWQAVLVFGTGMAWPTPQAGPDLFFLLFFPSELLWVPLTRTVSFTPQSCKWLTERRDRWGGPEMRCREEIHGEGCGLSPVHVQSTLCETFWGKNSLPTEQPDSCKPPKDIGKGLLGQFKFHILGKKAGRHCISLSITAKPCSLWS